MKNIQDLAFVLKMMPYGESDLIVHFLTKDHGKIVCFAKYARKSKRRMPHVIDYGNLLSIIFSESVSREFDKIYQASLKTAYHPIREDLKWHAIMNYFLEFMDEVVPIGSIPTNYFEFLKSTYDEIEFKIQPYVFVISVELNLLTLSGFNVNFQRCNHCQSEGPHELYFSISEGGVVCKKSSGRKMPEPIKPGTLMTLQKIQNIERREELRRIKINKTAYQEYRHMMNKYIENVFNKALKSATYMDEVLR